MMSLILIFLISLISYLAFFGQEDYGEIYPRFVSIKETKKIYAEKIESVSHSERFTHPQLNAPESICMDPKTKGIYTGTADGAVKYINLQKQSKLDIENIVTPFDFYQTSLKFESSHFNKNYSRVALNTLCIEGHLTRRAYDSESYEQICGRVLGIRWDREKKNLLIANAYYGVFKYNIEKKQLTMLANLDHEGKPFKFVNDIIQEPKTGDIYFTDTSKVFQRRDHRRDIIEDTHSGRLFKLESSATTKKKKK